MSNWCELLRRVTTSEDDQRAGFTLAETLIALVLIALVASFVFGGLRIGSRATQEWSKESMFEKSVQTTDRVLRMTLESAYPTVIPEQQSGYNIRFNGGDRYVEYSAPTKAITGDYGIHRVRLFKQDNQLVFAWMQERGDNSGFDVLRPLGERVLIKNLRNLEVSYYGENDETGSARWHRDWTPSTTVPELIELKMRFEENKRERFVTIRIAPRIDVDGACVFDPLLSTCRGR